MFSEVVPHNCEDHSKNLLGIPINIGKGVSNSLIRVVDGWFTANLPCLQALGTLKQIYIKDFPIEEMHIISFFVLT